MILELDGPTLAIDHDGRTIVFVPVAGSSRPAKLFSEDWHRLSNAGVGMGWYRKKRRYVYCGKRNTPDCAIVARLLLRCLPDQRVLYHDGDQLNLRRDNLWIKAASSRGRRQHHGGIQ